MDIMNTKKFCFEFSSFVCWPFYHLYVHTYPLYLNSTTLIIIYNDDCDYLLKLPLKLFIITNKQTLLALAYCQEKDRRLSEWKNKRGK